MNIIKRELKLRVLEMKAISGSHDLPLIAAIVAILFIGATQGMEVGVLSFLGFLTIAHGMGYNNYSTWLIGRVKFLSKHSLSCVKVATKNIVTYPFIKGPAARKHWEEVYDQWDKRALDAIEEKQRTKDDIY